jgi:hypothetical protein
VTLGDAPPGATIAATTAPLDPPGCESNDLQLLLRQAAAAAFSACRCTFGQPRARGTGQEGRTV